MNRSSMIRLALAGVALLVVVSPPAPVSSQSLRVTGYGLHTEGPTKVVMLPTGPRTLGPLSTAFSVSNETMLCAVGEAGGQVAPFNMLVYAIEITTSEFRSLPNGTQEFFVTGLARSITTVGGVTLEDANTYFEATAADGGAPLAGDYFHILIDTSLWPHQRFGKDLDGNPIQPYSGDVAIGRPVAGAGS